MKDNILKHPAASNAPAFEVKPKKTGILSDQFLEQYKEKTPPFGPLGFVTYKRTYARKVHERGVPEAKWRTEEWWETCRREIEGIQKLGAKFSAEEAEQLYDDTFNLRCSFSGRGKWQLGTKTVQRIGGASLNACWGIVLDDWMAFVFAFDMLMLGGGVGFNVQKEYVYALPKIKRGVHITRQDSNDADFIVPDSREGWTELLKKALEAFFVTGKSFSYSTVCIRTKGAPIRGFGGTASGPEDLCNGIADISDILRSRQGKKVNPIDCLDIMNIIGRVVVSGNVRRSALLALGDHDDRAYINAKRWDLGGIPNWRSHSNNSVVCNDIENLPDDFWNGYYGNGEPYGLINLKLSRESGRVWDKSRTDPDVAVFNPCAEICLSPPTGTGQGEACNLIEIYLPRLRDKSEFVRICKLVYRVVKTIASQKYHWDETNRIVHENSRLGISVTGVCEFIPKVGKVVAADWLESGYQAIDEEDKRWSSLNNLNESIKLTCVKPSGTLSLLANVPPGVHPAYAPFYLRRIRFASDDPLLEVCRANGYHIEPKMEYDGTENRSMMIVSFPMKAPEGAVCAHEMTAIDQLEIVKFMNTHWSDNSTSVTVYYRKEELPAIKEWLSENYNENIKSVSFLLHSEHGFDQAPYEEITEEQYNEMSEKVKVVYSMDIPDIGAAFDDSQNQCAGGICPVK